MHIDDIAEESAAAVATAGVADNAQCIKDVVGKAQSLGREDDESSTVVPDDFDEISYVDFANNEHNQSDGDG